MSIYRNAFEYVLGNFIDALRAQSDDDDSQILERWNRVVNLDILEVVAHFRKEESESFDRWVQGHDHCVECGKELPRLEMYAYEASELTKVCYGHQLRNKWRSANGACYDCQKAFLDTHTLICPDCGSSYFRGNHLQVRCPSCQEKESLMVRHKTRASKLGRAATLTHMEWSQTLDYFHNTCAYCSGAYEVVEHFTPLDGGGDTTARNCVPACGHCNSVKKNVDARTDPERLAARLNIPIERLTEIETYLNTR
jgi:hypothetical protein